MTTMTSVGVPRPQPARRLGAGKAAAIAGSVALLGALATRRLLLAWEAGSGRGSNSFPTGSRGLTTSGDAQLAAISGDGRYLVHIKSERLQPSLWIRQTATSSDVQIVPPAPVRYDGLPSRRTATIVYYVTYELTGGVGTLYRVPVLGGTPQRVLEDVDSPDVLLTRSAAA